MPFRCAQFYGNWVDAHFSAVVGVICIKGNSRTLKTEWQFRFEAIDFFFEKQYSYEGRADGPIDFGFGEVTNILFKVRIEPEDIDWRPGVTQTGKLLIKLDYGAEEARPIAMYLSQEIVERLAFDSGKIQINYGAVYFEQFPETPQEVEAVGDRPHGVIAQLEEVLPEPTFNSEQFKSTSSKSIDVRLISQFNEARDHSSTVYQFLGYFRVLESLYSKKNVVIRKALKGSKELEMNFKLVITSGDFNNFVDEIVEIRNKCAHLKLGEDFGYAPIDPALKEEVEPYVVLLKDLSYQCIRSI